MPSLSLPAASTCLATCSGFTSLASACAKTISVLLSRDCNRLNCCSLLHGFCMAAQIRCTLAQGHTSPTVQVHREETVFSVSVICVGLINALHRLIQIRKQKDSNADYLKDSRVHTHKPYSSWQKDHSCGMPITCSGLCSIYASDSRVKATVWVQF